MEPPFAIVSEFVADTVPALLLSEPVSTSKLLSVSDVGFDVKAGSLYMTYQQQKERLASLAPAGSFANLGIKGIS